MSGLLVAGTTSDAGKTLVTSGICRFLARRGVRVAPFKAQNMSNNSMVCAGRHRDRPGPVRCRRRRPGSSPKPAMNPVLLKPGSDRRSHVVVLGKPAGRWKRVSSPPAGPQLPRPPSAPSTEPARATTSSSARAPVPRPRSTCAPATTSTWVWRGGSRCRPWWSATSIGVGCSPRCSAPSPCCRREDRALIAGCVINKFRGDVDLLRPGLDQLDELTGGPVLGVLPWLDRRVAGRRGHPAGRPAGPRRRRRSGRRLRVAAIRFPRAVQRHRPGRPGRRTRRRRSADGRPGRGRGRRRPRGAAGFPRDRLRPGLAARHRPGRRDRAARGPRGAGARHLRWLPDARGPSTTGSNQAPAWSTGSGLLPVAVTFGARRCWPPAGAWPGPACAATRSTMAWRGRSGSGGFLDGHRSGTVWGTLWHGAFENDAFRRAWLPVGGQRASRGRRPGRAGVRRRCGRRCWIGWPTPSRSIWTRRRCSPCWSWARRRACRSCRPARPSRHGPTCSVSLPLAFPKVQVASRAPVFHDDSVGTCARNSRPDGAAPL